MINEAIKLGVHSPSLKWVCMSGRASVVVIVVMMCCTVVVSIEVSKDRIEQGKRVSERKWVISEERV